MSLSNYISDLLYRYECVIVPNFGGFVTNNKSAKINSFSNTFHPPYKQITFNGHLMNNDGLLANYIASIDKIPYESALNYIKFEVEDWFSKLKYQDLDLENIGTITLQNDNLLFEPNQKINYLASSFGLSNIVSPEIKRESYKKQVEKLEEKAPILITPERKKAPNYLKYAAIFVLGFSVLGFGGKMYRNHQNNKVIVASEEQQKEMESKIENATFVISKPLPTLNLDIKVQKKSFHVIAGAFRFPENAQRKVEQLKAEGFNSRILGINKWGLTIVSFDSFRTREESYQSLHHLKQTKDKEAWVLVQAF